MPGRRAIAPPVTPGTRAPTRKTRASCGQGAAVRARTTRFGDMAYFCLVHRLELTARVGRLISFIVSSAPAIIGKERGVHAPGPRGAGVGRAALVSLGHSVPFFVVMG
jgi:hypothetical protein